MVSEKKGIFGNYRVIYLTEFNMYIDIARIVYVFSVKIVYFKGWGENIANIVLDICRDSKCPVRGKIFKTCLL